MVGMGMEPRTLSQVNALFPREFVREKKYQTEAETFGWSFVFEDFVSPELRNQANQMPVREPGWGEGEGEGGGLGRVI